MATTGQVARIVQQAQENDDKKRLMNAELEKYREFGRRHSVVLCKVHDLSCTVMILIALSKLFISLSANSPLPSNALKVTIL